MDSVEPTEQYSERESEHKALLKTRSSYQTPISPSNDDQSLYDAIHDLQLKLHHHAGDDDDDNKDDFLSTEFNFDEFTIYPADDEDEQCHFCTILCCVICVSMFIFVMFALITLPMIGNLDVDPVDLPHATAHFNITMLSKWNYTDFNNVNHTRLSDNIANAFITATNMSQGGESKDMLNIKYSPVNPLFGLGQNHQYRTQMQLVANISSEKAMDQMLSSMILETMMGNGTQITNEYQEDFLIHLQDLLESTIDEDMSVWDAQHRFEYPIVCTAKMMVNKITRGMLIGGIKYNHESMKAWTNNWSHEDVEPQQLFYKDSTLGSSFITISEFTHHHILCDMEQRVSKYMDENMKRDGSNIFKALNPFRINIDPKTVRCCVAADGNIEHDLPSNQCVGHQGDRECKMYNHH